MPTPPFRADHVGSFLRPKALIDARTAFKAGDIDAAALRAAEDEAIRGVVKFQEDLGLQGITDGEFRRTYFHTDFVLQLDGVEEAGGTQVKFHQHGGKELEYAPPVMKITGKVAHTRDIQRADYAFLASCTTRTPKVTIPSPTMLHFRGGRDAIDTAAYPELDDFYTDLAAAYRAEIASLAEAGCRYLQLDDTNLAYLCDETQRENARKRGMDPDALPRLYARIINDSIRDKPADMTVCVHLCRGNFRSSWAAEGGYEPVAEVLFNELAVDGYFLEYDDPRSGDFAPLRHVPKGKTVVLGLVTTKLGELESKDDVKRRIDEAAQFAPIDQLALSPQCGFSSTVHGNDIAVEQQAEKMRLVIDVAREVWG
ncbi:5-methyltetrahydropteroyltriglutamate--homocysteine S-methyltransferase [Sphingomonas koreensis]|jgi:5-methyltetrahydropteroyltriglutamate--homocysteine methyltransferase|uniref:5-methyltetrahydropteroyltriglutamate--homocysteine S-methyltransferase n=1 Tax=Sphingomonas koreensis TaxID=93064 RepID=A0A1L6JAY9_9SPHN|nr:5-methyltetrahydropteroyltriglutamate--homocysteine S-methyltransferase [Sphingomonas koreensis]APR53094.1 5-methyltetrahydropteroyltriglutamate--homocysteine S-methyltransferase [Sphingomonas koreensis]MDC7810229.1 5-methyltetrahydropteroyltriglutamate--homocysteine S-methyltransferase [Sphingomonas koreensis]RSU24779.1 5-methyltetrahydropteroyltriglutamate--homocysteine S-methyltransferase [Sphingomonas koreensis]RSU24915.1 5-methyltetrahydropteroyltriglutamate--homocysteine S-methyltransf